MRREYAATIQDQELEVFVQAREDGRWRVSVDGREHVVDAAKVRPGTWSLLVEGRSYVVDLDERRRMLAVLAGSTETHVILEDARRKRLARAMGGPATRGGSDEVVAPIAGKVVQVMVGPGDEVEEGQGVAVLEAMKMENEIKAERAGRVEVVHVTAGDSVETSQPLLEIVSDS
jgi:biotin carboxyl carrier protein